MKNQDTRFEQCTPYVFALTAYIEEKQLERNVVTAGKQSKLPVLAWDGSLTKGYNIIWTRDDGSLDSTEVRISVEFRKEDVIKQLELRKFLQEEVDESLHEFIRTNVFIATRNFLHRL